MIAERARESGLLVFAGAGISMIAPSSLPNWYEFNEAVLNALAGEVSSYTRPELGEWIFSGLVARRNQTPHFAPDYMADIIAEEVGMDYFKVVQTLDAEEMNTCHYAIAALARAGLVRAVVTTNFDRLIERAFAHLGVPHRVYATPAQFEELRDTLAGGAPDVVSIVKVHGTVDDAESMVDTMSQRLVGRPEALEAALAALYARHHILFLGFSGADLDYDPDYLGLRAAAQHNRGFTYLRRPRDRPRASVRDLRSVWGEGAAIIEGELPTWLVDIARQFEIDTDGWPAGAATVDRMQEVRRRAAEWATSLGRLQNVNILSALLRASGDDETAGRLFWGIWKHYRLPEDCQGPTYARFNHLLGRLLLEYGFTVGSLRPPTSIGFTVGPAPFDKDQLDNAFQYLGRAVSMGHAQALADFAACHALAGNCKRSVEMVTHLVEQAIRAQHAFALMDAALAGGLVWSMAGAWSDGLRQLEAARQIAARWGMETRRARLCAHLVRFHAWKQCPDHATERYCEGTLIAERLGMEFTRWELNTAWGYALVEQGRAAEATPLLSEACDYFQGTGRMAMLTRAALDLYHAAMLAGDQDAFDKASALLEEYERGYQPHVHALAAEAGLRFDNLAYARDQLDILKRTAIECENEWAAQVAQSLEQEIATRDHTQDEDA